ncbi:MAG: hypothetical protein CVU56_14530 [Deltaproteobacteria bacterium HGW-Deltaproteobacteria-14]|jgi:formate C-acetyltransferase|nr:MAG: hypothetical protein CVU56_14530 [Deltaproteobacteria bacterium HGW-Deltaproteobacteria-14]
MNARAPATDDRIARLRLRYQTGPAYVSIERARHYTAAWRATETSGLPTEVRVALAMRAVYRNMTHHLDPDDRIAGAWTEHFLGVPIDIERGVFNAVFEAELTRPRMIRARARTALRAAGYLARRGGLADFARGQRIARAHGGDPLSLALDPMPTRRVNPFQITPAARRELLGTLLPYWRGETLVDRLDAELAASGLRSRDMHDFVLALAGGASRQVEMVSTCATVATLQGHVILDHDAVLRLGLAEMLAATRVRRAAATDDAERAFLHAREIALDGVIIYARRLVQRVDRELAGERDPARRAVLEALRARCARVPLRPAETFAEAVQALWTVKTAVELAHPVNLHAFGRLDQILAPYYDADLAAGRVTPAAATELIEELLLKIMAQNLRPESNLLAHFYHRFLGSSPVTVGGLTPDGRDGTHPLTYLFVEAAGRSRAVTNLSVRVHPGTPDALLAAVAGHVAAGASSFSLYNDPVVTDAMERRGFAPEHARDYALMGCVEATCPGRTGGMSANALLLSRLLDVTLRDGDSALLAGTVRGEAPATGAGFPTFDALLDALVARGAFFVEKIVRASNLRDRLYAEHLPAPFISAFIDGCLERGRDVTRGGARYDLAGVSLINAIANLVDALHVIRALVFERQVCTIGELLAAIDADFVGAQGAALLAAIRAVPGRWGNGDPAVDQLAHDVTQRLSAEVLRHRSFRGGPFVVYVISMITHTIDGRLSVATADGRRAATPFAASCNPANVEHAGVTAALRSVAALPFEDILGASVNLKLHPSAIGATAAARAKFVALVRGYFALGGAQLQPTGVSAETLRAARRDPEAHRDLVVKVGGYSSYFVDLGREVQDEIIARTEHQAAGA